MLGYWIFIGAVLTVGLIVTYIIDCYEDREEKKNDTFNHA